MGAPSRAQKDAMRTDCIPVLVEAWFQLLQAAVFAAPDVAVGVLKVLARYIGQSTLPPFWYPLSLRCLSMLFLLWFIQFRPASLSAPCPRTHTPSLPAWIDLGLVVNERFLGLLFSTLSPPPDASRAAAAPAAVPAEKVRRAHSKQ